MTFEAIPFNLNPGGGPDPRHCGNLRVQKLRELGCSCTPVWEVSSLDARLARMEELLGEYGEPEGGR
jgi:hypothetical protein